jgi:hypothetical protein
VGAANPLVDLNPCYLELAAEPERRQQLWREFLLGDDPKEALLRQAEFVAGDEDFCRRLKETRGRVVQPRHGRPRKRVRPAAKMSEQEQAGERLR